MIGHELMQLNNIARPLCCLLYNEEDGNEDDDGLDQTNQLLRPFCSLLQVDSWTPVTMPSRLNNKRALPTHELPTSADRWCLHLGGKSGTFLAPFGRCVVARDNVGGASG